MTCSRQGCSENDYQNVFNKRGNRIPCCAGRQNTSNLIRITNHGHSLCSARANPALAIQREPEPLTYETNG